MQLTEIRIKNYRLLIDAILDVDTKTTLIVGRNNTARRSDSLANIKSHFKTEKLSNLLV